MRGEMLGHAALPPQVNRQDILSAGAGRGNFG
jgi:hypothetical protein